MGPQTDAQVPAGHASLHATLYGEGGAEAHDSHGPTYSLRQDQDDGSVLVPVEQWLQDRDGEKPLGVYALYSEDKAVQYIGFSRNTVTAVRSHLAKVGAQRAAFVRSMVFANKAMATRETLERQVDAWVEAAGGVPPGNGPDRELWEGASKALSAVELAEYEAKTAKMKRAMGEGRDAVLAGAGGPANGSVYSEEELRAKREAMLQAVEGDNWSAVIDQQTRDAVGAPGSSPHASSSSQLPSEASGSASPGGSSGPSGGAASRGPVVSPFSSATVHRSIGEKGGPAGAGAEGGAAAVEMTVASVDAALSEVRPYLMADGGDVEVAEVSGGRVFLRLQGACSTCASSQSTMKMGIERALRAAFGDALLEVIQIDKVEVIQASVANIDMHLNMLRGAIHGLGGSVEVAAVDGNKCTVRYKGPAAIGKGIAAAIKDQFPTIQEVVMV